MRCPECESENTKVWLTRHDREKNWVCRGRKCLTCGTNWRTTEIPDSDLTFLEGEDGDDAGEESQD